MNDPIEEIRLRLPHIELAAQLYGPPDGMPVVALHGWLDNANSFARLAPLLPGLRIVALDLAGHGYSEHRPAGAGYALWDYAHDVLQVAEQLGWQRFALMGHSLGAIISMMFAAALPERIERLVLIDGLVPPTASPEGAARRLGEALQAQLALPNRRKRVYAEMDRAVEARRKGVVAVSREAAELLARRGLAAVHGGYSWRHDPRLTLPSAARLTDEQALAYVSQVACPTRLIVAEAGILATRHELLEALPFIATRLPGGHHLHLNDETGAQAVAQCINRFFDVS
ncbi:alpha/beta hydrolase [Pseudomonas sp. dw_358]|uniref:alpha/beta hydrolase n=1 Tax=Pseudomonas sp. dw_358 TaxID=2720083 RepID=UPI001BD3486A|nr:alpha/beta hydrolase [Pseudomonas sp. dw_358]